MTVSDLIAQFFAKRGCEHAFTISGAGNLRLLDAIHRLGKTTLVSCHHEQACAQAAIGYYRVSGKIAPCIVTCGGGAANIVTGIVSAWMDSIPLFVIAGQENFRNEKLRAYGVQGLNLSKMVHDVCKGAICIVNDPNIAGTIDESYRHAIENRPGPVIIEIPMNVQGAQC